MLGPKKLVFACMLFKQSQETSFCSYVWKYYYYFSGTNITCSLVAFCAFAWLRLCPFSAFGAFLCFWSVQNLFIKKKIKSSIITLITHSFTIWGYQDNFKPVYFFYKRILHVKKHSCLQQHIDSNPSNLFICILTNFYEVEINTYTHWGFCLRASID